MGRKKKKSVPETANTVLTPPTQRRSLCYYCCCPCRAIAWIGHKIVSIVATRSCEEYLSKNVRDALFYLLLSSSFGIAMWQFFVDYKMQIVASAWDASMVTIGGVKTVFSTAVASGSTAVSVVSGAWNVTVSTLSTAGESISGHVGNGLDFLAPYLNATSSTTAVVSSGFQQGYDKIMPFINETRTYLRQNIKT